MITRRINAYLKDMKLWQRATPACRNAFTRAMRGRDDGRVQTIVSMVWFVEGWKASDIARLNDTLGQVNSEPQAASEAVPENITIPEALGRRILHHQVDNPKSNTQA
jgi:hypothetical protein